MRGTLIALATAGLSFALAAGSHSAAAQSAELRAERQYYAGLPFTVAVVAEDFDEKSEPEQPTLTINGATVRPLGVAPNVSRGVRIVNGRRSQWTEVTYVMRWRVEIAQPGTYMIPAMTIEQGGKRAKTREWRIQVRDIPSSPDMKIAMELPSRQVWAGETVPVFIDWLLRRDVVDQSIMVPMLENEDRFRVRAGDAQGKNTITFPAGSGEIELPLDQQGVVVDGKQFTRVRFTALVTPLEAGKLEIEPSAVVAKLKVGPRRRSVFDRQKVGLYKAVDIPRTLDVKPLPLQGRPAGFAGAVGTSFSIAARASRSVVKLGEPVEIAITVRSDRDLEGIRLPDFGHASALDPSKFSVPEEPPVGELDADGTSKTFTLVVQIKDPSVRQIPALSFPFFDPEKGEYRSATSEAIAMQVEGAVVVSAGDVVSTQSGKDGPTGASAVSVRGADLGLSSASDTSRTVLSTSAIRPLLWLLYIVPVLLLIGRILWLRRKAAHSEDAEVREASAALREALERAAKTPARECVGAVSTALGNLARATGGDAAELIERLETAAFAPGAADAPVAADLRKDIEEASASMTRTSAPGKATVAAVTLVLVGLSAGHAHATAQSQARESYQQAMSSADRDVRTARFANAASIYRELAADGTQPELLTDWGNAALGAGDRATAVLAYRRALRLDPGMARARTNLEWARQQMPSWLPRATDEGAVDSLFFWHRSMTLARRHLVGAVGFALALILLTPWSASARRRRLARRLALLPAAVWLAMVISIGFEADRSRDAVVVTDGEILRAADSAGAPAALANPLPGGAEVQVEDERQGWVRISLADGTRGWLPQHAVTKVTPSGPR